MKPHTIAVNLVLPAAKILVRNLIGEKEAEKLNSVSLSNDKVRRRIHDMSDDISDQVTTAVRASKYGSPCNSMSRPMSPTAVNCLSTSGSQKMT